MKDVRQCSISSVAFTLDVDAYQTLFDYIEALRARYADNDDGEEIISDIETRIAELILSVNGGDRVVAKPLIDNIIAQLGSVDDICDSEEPSVDPSFQSQSNAESQTDTGEQKQKTRRKLYRNIDNAPIGGVCSGIAAYIGCEIAVVRLLALLLLLFAGFSVWVYIVLWIVMPAAVTARQKLEMRGEPITVSSINDYYNSMMGDKQRQSAISSFLSFIGRVLMLLFKAMLIVVLILLLLSFVAIIFSLFVVVVTLGSIGGWAVSAVAVMAMISLGMLLALAIYAVMQVINSREIKGNTIFVALIVWLLFSIATALLGVANINSIRWMINEVKEMMHGDFQFKIGDDQSAVRFNLNKGDFSEQSQETLDLLSE